MRSMEDYVRTYQESIDDPEKFWGKCAERLHWFEKWHHVYRRTEGPFVKWFEGGKINACYNCVDRHLDKKNKAAIIWEGEEGNTETYTFQQLHREVSRFANVLKQKGIEKGDRVCIYLPMIPELAIAVLACARIGAIHSVVFAGFSAESLKQRIIDSEAKVLITANALRRRGKLNALKEKADKILAECDSITNVIVTGREAYDVHMEDGRDLWYGDLMKDAPVHCDCEALDAEDSLFILYTSGTTGKPKGMLHTIGGYMTYVSQTSQWVFDLQDNDTYWCTADIGWITGHSYILYGPLSNGVTTLMFEGVPTYPEPDRFWQVVEKHKVNIFYTAPTAIRLMMKFGDELVKKHDTSSLRILGSVGEPINPKAWQWYNDVVGEGRCPIVDTWWQTETGGILISPIPGATETKPGSATFPLPGIQPAVLKEDGSEAQVNEPGYLVIKNSWPGIARTIWNNPERYEKTYFSKFHDFYFTGDGAKEDSDGYYWLMGRIDDVMNVSGHRLGTAEIESGLVSHPAVAEAAVVPVPHEVKGDCIYAFVTLKEGSVKSDQLKEEIINHIREHVGPIAKPEKLQFADALPKTRSGKIMRRILKRIAAGEDDVGNTTTLADPSVVDKLKEEREAV